jgi:hypothetical protein
LLLSLYLKIRQSSKSILIFDPLLLYPPTGAVTFICDISTSQPVPPIGPVVLPTFIIDELDDIKMSIS